MYCAEAIGRLPVGSVLEVGLCIMKVSGGSMLLAFEGMAFIASLGERGNIWTDMGFALARELG